MQAVLHQLQEQQLSALFTSSQKRGSIQQLLQTITQRLKADKPNADMLMIMAVGTLAQHAYISANIAISWHANCCYAQRIYNAWWVTHIVQPTLTVFVIPHLSRASVKHEIGGLQIQNQPEHALLRRIWSKINPWEFNENRPYMLQALHCSIGHAQPQMKACMHLCC